MNFPPMLDFPLIFTSIPTISLSVRSPKTKPSYSCLYVAPAAPTLVEYVSLQVNAFSGLVQSE